MPSVNRFNYFWKIFVSNYFSRCCQIICLMLGLRLIMALFIINKKLWVYFGNLWPFLSAEKGGADLGITSVVLVKLFPPTTLLPLNFFFSPSTSLLLTYPSPLSVPRTYVSVPTYLKLSTYLLMYLYIPISSYLPTFVSVHTYLKLSTYLPTYLCLPISSYIPPTYLHLTRISMQLPKGYYPPFVNQTVLFSQRWLLLIVRQFYVLMLCIKKWYFVKIEPNGTLYFQIISLVIA